MYSYFASLEAIAAIGVWGISVLAHAYKSIWMPKNFKKNS